MRTTREYGRTVALALTIGGLAAFTAPTGAEACEDNYTIQSGDTLGAIAVRCGTTVAALAEANEVDPRRLRLGQVITIPASEPVVRESSRTRPEAVETDTSEMAEAAADNTSGATYTVEAGDTPARIARMLGISVETLLDANPQLVPHRMQVGQSLHVPDDQEVRRILTRRQAEREQLEAMRRDYPDPVLQADKGEWRLTVDLTAEGLAPNETVRVAVRGPRSAWITLGDMPADDEGRMVARARIPAELVGEPALRFAIERPWGDHVSRDYAVNGTGDVRVAARKSKGAVRVAGKVVRGGGCDILVTGAGESYALAGAAHRLRPGSRVVVTGTEAGTAAAADAGCVGGQAALNVVEIEPRA